MPDDAVPQASRLRVRVRGIVQGVGFRPFVWRLAHELALDGWVANDAEGVIAEVQGSRPALEEFVRRVQADAPPLAAVRAVEPEPMPAAAVHGFAIAASGGGVAATPVSPDAAPCAACVAELFDPADRRYRYPFINCTHCGPRYTITHSVPYDRPRTTMAPFAMCPSCQAEYDDPADRRFHAQPDACAACGPRLAMLDGHGRPLSPEDVVAATLDRLRAGGIVAIKGLGGFHLACDARDPAAVARLRSLKHRDEKPFAVMAASVESLRAFADISRDEAKLLESHERPVVLLDKRPGIDGALGGVADGLASLGAMLPSTPLHWLLFHEAAGRPAGTAWLREAQPLLLVMTSANPGGEPLVVGNDEAVRRLRGIADAFVVHDRDIAARCDDSVVRGVPGGLAFVRRARGYSPRAIRLPRTGPSVIATGAWLKNAACVTRGDEAFLTPHVGDLESGATCEALVEAIDHLVQILEVEPVAVAHDLHPDFWSTHHAMQLAQAHGSRSLAVQHHHAHIAAVAAEHRIDRPVLGVALDGVGLGTDGQPWGGELLLVDGANCTRLGHLQALRLPGGDRAAREPWRMAAAVLDALGRGEEIVSRFPRSAAEVVARMLRQDLRCPATSSAGRWFDAAAGILGVREVSGFEGQAAMQLEALASAHGPVEPEATACPIDSQNRLVLLPLLERLTAETDPARGAARFHASLVAALATWIGQAARREGLDTVALGGGCFMNRILSEGLRRALASRGLAVLEARQAPANDGGIALGQAWVALQEVS